MTSAGKTIKLRLKSLEQHLRKENPVLVAAVQSYRHLDRVGYSLGLLNEEQSFATQISSRYWVLFQPANPPLSITISTSHCNQPATRQLMTSSPSFALAVNTVHRPYPEQHSMPTRASRFIKSARNWKRSQQARAGVLIPTCN